MHLNINPPLSYILIVLFVLAIYRYALDGLGYLIFGTILLFLFTGLFAWLAFDYARRKVYAFSAFVLQNLS